MALRARKVQGLRNRPHLRSDFLSIRREFVSFLSLPVLDLPCRDFTKTALCCWQKQSHTHNAIPNRNQGAVYKYFKDVRAQKFSRTDFFKTLTAVENDKIILKT